MTNRSSLWILLLIALLTWGGLLLFTRYVPPHSIAAFIAFFLILSIALTSTIAPIAYFISHRVLPRHFYRTTIRQAIRQGALLTLVVILNLILRALHSWNIFMAIVILVAAIMVEALFLAKK
ncbi:MAG: hypothetical protein JOZ18_12555 [Chloroflexi bacterium]|nr:hypothetical protein [Chloroflexota bacterium]